MPPLNLMNRALRKCSPVSAQVGTVPPVAAGIGKTSERYGWSRSEIYRLLASGKLRAVK